VGRRTEEVRCYSAWLFRAGIVVQMRGLQAFYTVRLFHRSSLLAPCGLVALLLVTLAAVAVEPSDGKGL